MSRTTPLNDSKDIVIYPFHSPFAIYYTGGRIRCGRDCCESELLRLLNPCLWLLGVAGGLFALFMFLDFF